MWRVVTLGLVMAAAARALVQDSMDGLGQPPDRYCLACLCTAATGCDTSTGCEEDGGTTICGPFYISQPYWLDANTTVVQQFRDYDFSRCARDVACAKQTVTSYMTKFSRDCDGDGRVTCLDHGLMHYLGYSQCAVPAQRQQAEASAFYHTFSQCLADMDALLVSGMMQQHLPGCDSSSHL
ncbi:invertebrate-type lysozyme-like [Pollicipes pollicipes]|uniref:invertebrate-type lysozyme-like n=1 Tax=Pollicipes pollicipes TaxID=41117 RepID=UPI001884DB03|nr:invertebrate-type lysozyme-like [Pollicipes pollicipes]